MKLLCFIMQTPLLLQIQSLDFIKQGTKITETILVDTNEADLLFGLEVLLPDGFAYNILIFS